MPRLFKLGNYYIYFWSNEAGEPVHVHVALGRQRKNATKIWITSNFRCLLCNNNSKIPYRTLVNIIDTIETQAKKIVSEWEKRFGEVKFYC